MSCGGIYLNIQFNSPELNAPLLQVQQKDSLVIHILIKKQNLSSRMIIKFADNDFC